MRITNGMIINTYNRDLNSNLSRLNKYQQQLSTNKRINRLSDDPVGVVSSLRARSKIANIGIYRKNIDDGTSLMTAAETALNDINSSIKRIYELSVDLANGSKTPEDRQNGAREVGQLMKHIVSTLNTTYNDKYTFGSFNVTSQPVEVGPVEIDPGPPAVYEDRLFFNGLDISDPANAAALKSHAEDVARYEVDQGIWLEMSITTTDIMGTGENNTYNILRKLYDELMSPDSTTDNINLMLDDLQMCQERTLDCMAEIGGRMNRLEMLETRFSMDNINYEELRSKVEDVNTAEAITYFMMAESVYKASLAVGSRVIQPTLVDFMS